MAVYLYGYCILFINENGYIFMIFFPVVLLYQRTRYCHIWGSVCRGSAMRYHGAEGIFSDNEIAELLRKKTVLSYDSDGDFVVGNLQGSGSLECGGWRILC